MGVAIPMAQKIRGKNDPFSWFAGGAAAGVVFGLKSKVFLMFTWVFV